MSSHLVLDLVVAYHISAHLRYPKSGKKLSTTHRYGGTTVSESQLQILYQYGPHCDLRDGKSFAVSSFA